MNSGVKMKCCASCFGDRWLRKSVIPSLSNERGKCSYCLSENETLVHPSELAEYFVPVINIYTQDEGGRLLVEWLRDDWGIFRHEKMENSRAKDLLAEILDDGEIVRRMYSPQRKYEFDRISQWENLRDELMYNNRYFPNTKIDWEHLGQLLSHIIADDLPAKWFRARIQSGDTIYSENQMGAPPKRIASHGRANPPGIPYLYLGSTLTTAISEVRPHTGQTACIADFIIPSGKSLIDIRHPRQLVSPFLLGDEDQIGLLRNDIAFLERLGEELTRPILPDGASIDYVPSQLLCEFIKKQGYAGVVYRSSVGDGMNLALFVPSDAIIGKVQQYEVERVIVQLK